MMSVAKEVIKRYKEKTNYLIEWNNTFLVKSGYSPDCINNYNKIILFGDIMRNINTIFTDENHIIKYGDKKDEIVNKIREEYENSKVVADIANENLYERNNNLSLNQRKNRVANINDLFNDSNKKLSNILKLIYQYGTEKDFEYIFTNDLLCIDLTKIYKN